MAPATASCSPSPLDPGSSLRFASLPSGVTMKGKSDGSDSTTATNWDAVRFASLAVLHRLEPPLQVGDEVLGVFQADAEAHHRPGEDRAFGAHGELRIAVQGEALKPPQEKPRPKSSRASRKAWTARAGQGLNTTEKRPAAPA